MVNTRGESENIILTTSLTSFTPVYCNSTILNNATRFANTLFASNCSAKHSLSDISKFERIAQSFRSVWMMSNSDDETLHNLKPNKQPPLKMKLDPLTLRKTQLPPRLPELTQQMSQNHHPQTTCTLMPLTSLSQKILPHLDVNSNIRRRNSEWE